MKKENNKKVIGIVFITLEENRTKLREILQSIYDVCMVLYGVKFELRCIPFYNYNNQDIKFYQSLLKEMNNDDISVCPYQNDMTNIIEEFCELDFIVSMRYHATLVSKILEIPSISIWLEEHPHYYNKMKAITEIGNTKDLLMKFENIEKKGFCEVLKKQLSSNCERSFDSEVLNQAEEELKKIIKDIFDGGK